MGQIQIQINQVIVLGVSGWREWRNTTYDPASRHFLGCCGVGARHSRTAGVLIHVRMLGNIRFPLDLPALLTVFICCAG